jgi:hypothetical protein
LSAQDTILPAARSEPAPTAGVTASWRERVGRALSWLTVPDVSPTLAEDLAKLTAAIRSLTAPSFAHGPLLPLESRELIGAIEERDQSATQAAFWRYARGRRAPLAEADLESLRQDLARVAADPGPALASGRLLRYGLQQVLDELGIPGEKAAALLLEDLRHSLSIENAKRLSWHAATAALAPRIGSRSPLLTKGQLDAVFSDMGHEGPITAFDAKQPVGELWGRQLQKLPSDADRSIEGFWRKLRGAEAPAEPVDPGSEEGEAREVVRLLERLVELARKYTVDLVGVLEHYLETAQRLWREAQRAQARRQLVNDKRAIERTLAELDPRELARSMAALPLYLHYHESGGEAILGTGLLPRLADERLTRSYARLCLRLLQPPYTGQLEAPSADRPPPAEGAAPTSTP